MPRYRNRPREIEATQWFPSKVVEGVFEEATFSVADSSPPGAFPAITREANRYFVVTMQRQKVYIKPGEYVVAESDGMHHYPIDSDEFDKLYERVR